MTNLPKYIQAILFSIILLGSNNAFAEIKILSSIRPIFYLVEGVNQGINPQQLLVGGRVSPHDYQPKPSDIGKIRDANIIFRIDDHFQPRFSKLFAANAKNATIISLADIQNLSLMANEAHLDDQHAEEAGHNDADHGHSHTANEFDLHIWLSPDNAILITDTIALELTKLDPKNREKYQYNAKAQNEQLRLLDQRLHQQLAKFKGQNFFSQHDAYGYFTTSFGLEHSIALTPKRHQLSAKRLQELVEIAQQKNISCIMLEPQLNDKIAKTIVKTKNDIKVETWDPLGFDLELNANSYHILLKSMAENLTTCLTKD